MGNIHGYKTQEDCGVGDQIECARLLLNAGADKHVTNRDGEHLL